MHTFKQHWLNHEVDVITEKATQLLARCVLSEKIDREDFDYMMSNLPTPGKEDDHNRPGAKEFHRKAVKKYHHDKELYGGSSDGEDIKVVNVWFNNMGRSFQGGDGTPGGRKVDPIGSPRWNQFIHDLHVAAGVEPQSSGESSSTNQQSSSSTRNWDYTRQAADAAWRAEQSRKQEERQRREDGMDPTERLWFRYENQFESALGRLKVTDPKPGGNQFDQVTSRANISSRVKDYFDAAKKYYIDNKDFDMSEQDFIDSFLDPDDMIDYLIRELNRDYGEVKDTRDHINQNRKRMDRMVLPSPGPESKEWKKKNVDPQPEPQPEPEAQPEPEPQPGPADEPRNSTRYQTKKSSTMDKFLKFLKKPFRGKDGKPNAKQDAMRRIDYLKSIVEALTEDMKEMSGPDALAYQSYYEIARKILQELNDLVIKYQRL